MFALCQEEYGVCRQCGKPISAGIRRTCRKKKVYDQEVQVGPKAESPFALGDFVEARLTSIGITTKSWCEFKKQYGLPAGCNCPARKEWLNRFGEQFGGLAARIMDYLTRGKEPPQNLLRETP